MCPGTTLTNKRSEARATVEGVSRQAFVNPQTHDGLTCAQIRDAIAAEEKDWLVLQVAVWASALRLVVTKAAVGVEAISASSITAASGIRDTPLRVTVLDSPAAIGQVLYIIGDNIDF